MASNVLPPKRPFPSGSSPSSIGEKKTKMENDDFDFLIDEMDSMEEEMRNSAKLHPPATPTVMSSVATPSVTPIAMPTMNGTQKATPMSSINVKHDLKTRPDWVRPPPPPIDPAKDTITFQQVDIDHYIGSPIPGMPGLCSGPVPILRMYGVTMEGNSVCAQLHGFLPYFYVNLPSEQFSSEHCSDFRCCLNRVVLGDMRSNKDITTAVVSVEICER